MSGFNLPRLGTVMQMEPGRSKVRRQGRQGSRTICF